MKRVALILAMVILTGVLTSCKSGMSDVEKQIAEESMITEAEDSKDNSAAVQLNDNDDTLKSNLEGENFYDSVSVHDVSETDLLELYGINGGKSEIFLILDSSKVDKIVVKGKVDSVEISGDDIRMLSDDANTLGQIADGINKVLGNYDGATADELNTKLLEGAEDRYYGKLWFCDSEGSINFITSLRLDENTNEVNYTALETDVLGGYILVYGLGTDTPVKIDGADACSLLYSIDYTGLPPEEEVSY